MELAKHDGVVVVPVDIVEARHTVLSEAITECHIRCRHVVPHKPKVLAVVLLEAVQ